MLENVTENEVNCGAWQTSNQYHFQPHQQGLVDKRDVRELIASGAFQEVN